MLREKAAALGIASRVTFSGYVSDTRLVYLASDVLLMPSRYEGLPMTLLEAMAMGLPVVASKLDGIAEVIGDGEEGFLVPPTDAALFVERTASLLTDTKLSSCIAKNARAKIEARFSVERMTSAVEDIYDRFLP
jgi:glycosyltransferase involved in cell wall biosynthesis